MNTPAGFDHERRWNRIAVDEPVEWGLSADYNLHTRTGAQLVCYLDGYRGPQIPTFLGDGQRATSGQNVEGIGPTQQRWATSTSGDGRCCTVRVCE